MKKKSWSDKEAKKILNCFARCLGWDEVVLVMFEAAAGSVYDPNEKDNRFIELYSENSLGQRAWTDIVKKAKGELKYSNIYVKGFADALDKILDILHSEDIDLRICAIQIPNTEYRAKNIDSKAVLDLWKFELALEGIELYE